MYLAQARLSRARMLDNLNYEDFEPVKEPGSDLPVNPLDEEDDEFFDDESVIEGNDMAGAGNVSVQSALQRGQG